MTTASTKTIARFAARLAAGTVLLLAAVTAADAQPMNGTQLDGLRLEGLQQPAIEGAASGCPSWICGENGTQRDGLRLEGPQQPVIDGAAGGCLKWYCGDNGTQLDGLRLEDLQQPLPSGEGAQQASTKTKRGFKVLIIKKTMDKSTP